VLIHKSDIIGDPVERQRTFEERQAHVLERSAGIPVKCFATSIWDETLYKAWSAIVYSLIPDMEVLEKRLKKLCDVCDADEVVLFEHATFLVISHATSRTLGDAHRFEKISNIIKQFKLSCGKSMATFQSMTVSNGRCSAYIDVFTANTYAMVITTDRAIHPAVVHHNLASAKSHFDSTLQL